MWCFYLDFRRWESILLAEKPFAKVITMKKITLLSFFLLTLSFCSPYVHIDATLADFSGGDTVLIDFLTPDPDGSDNCAIALARNDTLRVLQVYPDDHCIVCLADAVAMYMGLGHPALNIKFEVVSLSSFNSLHDPDDSTDVYNPITGLRVGHRAMSDYHIVLFGVANGFGGRSNDISTSARNAVIQFGRRGGGVILTHDTIAMRRGWTFTEPLCTDTRNFTHDNFNQLTPVTGLDADWVTCYEPDNRYTEVTLEASADATAPILHYPFELPRTFTVTECHDFGERYAEGDVWYRGPDGQVYMHSYYDPTYESFAAYFSTGHEEEYHGTSFRPSEWETKALINSMFFSFYGGRGNGVYESNIVEASCTVNMDSLSLRATTPGSSFIVVEARASMDGSAWTPWLEIVPGTVVPPEIYHWKFFQYRLMLSKGTPADSPPIVHAVYICGNQDTPEATLISPALNAVTACPNGQIRFLVHSTSALRLENCRITLDGTSYSGSVWTVYGDTLVFNSPAPLASGVTHSGSLTFLENTTGCFSETAVPFVFTVDLMPPQITLFEPSTASPVGGSFFIRARIIDFGTAVDSGELFVTNGDDTLDFSVAGFMFRNDTLTVTPAAVESLHLSGLSEICIFAADTISSALCGPNDTLFCFEIYVDVSAPTIACPEDFITACELCTLKIHVVDDVDVAENRFRVVTSFGTFIYPTAMAYSRDTLSFTPDHILTDGESFELIVFAEDIFANATNCTTSVTVDRAAPAIALFPPPNTVFETPFIETHFCISADASGLDLSHMRLVVGVDTFTLGDGIIADTCFSFFAETGVLDGETVTLQLLDITDSVTGNHCGPNSAETSWVYEVNLPAPVSRILTPDNNICLSCSLFEIRALVLSGAPLARESTLVLFEAETLTLADSRLHFSGDTLVFEPSVPYAHGENVCFELLKAEDELGAESWNLASVAVRVDLRAPVITSTAEGIDTVFDPLAPFSFTVFDDVCGTNFYAVEFNGTPLADSFATDCADTTLHFAFDPTTLGTHYPEAQISTISVVAYDCAELCGAHVESLAVSFFVPDDDTLPPAMVITAPHIWLEDSTFVLELAIIDSSGVYAPALLSDPFDAYAIYDNDGELDVTFARSELHLARIVGDTTFLVSDAIPPQTAFVPFIWRASFYDNDFDFSNVLDRLAGFAEIESVTIIPRPTFTLLAPRLGVFTSCNDDTIAIIVASTDPIITSSLVFEVAAQTIIVPSDRAEQRGDTIIIAPPTSGYSEGIVIVRLVAGTTELGYTIPEQNWAFEVDATPPALSFTAPTSWEMVSEPGVPVEVLAADFGAGVDTSSVSAFFVVRAETIDADGFISITVEGQTSHISISTNALKAGDTVEVVCSACDSAENCGANCDTVRLNFWIEPNFPCALSTNPITPNGDGFNDEVRFLYPKPFSNKVKITLFDTAGRKVFERDVPAADLDAQLWNGERDGRTLPTGTYFYVIETSSDVLCRGSLTIVH